MNDIAKVFTGGHKALIAYVTAGYPSREITEEAVPLLAKNGCDIVEIGIPFSDPLADGTTIQKASFAALHNGITPATCLDMAKKIRTKTDIPLVFMSYYNPIYACGLQKFVIDCKAAGVNGLIIPNLPPEEGESLETITRQADLDLIYLVAPTSTEQRIEKIAARSRGFIYMVSVAGVTGARNTLPVDLGEFVARVKTHTHLPLCVGFGISAPEQARKVAGFADGVIIGSRIVQILEGPDWKTELVSFAQQVRRALDRQDNQWF
jgi:tryptophan synthase alpha chain